MSDTLASLESRHEIERRFHDEQAAAAQPKTHDFYSIGGMQRVLEDFEKATGDIRGKTVLDFGCGDGARAIEYAKRGADVYAFDIAAEYIKIVSQNAEAAGVGSRVHPAVMPAEHLTYPDQTFDLVLGVAILHHTDVALVEQEIARVLKPGGRALFIEPLDHNPFLKLFRALTPGRRTPTEQPMSITQIRTFMSHFQGGTTRGYYLTSIFPCGLYWATGNKALFDITMAMTEAVDRWTLRLLPFTQRYCWMTMFDVTR
jgi:ubiquinone/menaquinone biosynthesis C-methylase UbiE